MKHFSLGVVTGHWRSSPSVASSICSLDLLKFEPTCRRHSGSDRSRTPRSTLGSAVEPPEVPNPIVLTDENLVGGRQALSQRMRRTPRHANYPNQSSDTLLPAYPGPSFRGHTVLRSANFLDSQTRCPPFGYVRERQMGFGSEAVDHHCLHCADQIAASARPQQGLAKNRVLLNRFFGKTVSGDRLLEKIVFLAKGSATVSAT